MYLHRGLISILKDFSSLTDLALMIYDEGGKLLFQARSRDSCRRFCPDSHLCGGHLLQVEGPFFQCKGGLTLGILRIEGLTILAGQVLTTHPPYPLQEWAQEKGEEREAVEDVVMTQEELEKNLAFLSSLLKNTLTQKEEGGSLDSRDSVESIDLLHPPLGPVQDFHESQRRYRLLVDNSPDLIFSFDMDLRFTAVNKSLCQLFQVREEDVIGQDIRALGFPEEMVEEGKKIFKEVLEAGEAFSNEITSLMPDNRVHTFESFLYPLLDEDGEVIGLTGVTRDITEKKEMERDLAKKSQRLTEAQHLANIGNWEWEIKEDRVYWSDEVFWILHREPQEFTPTMDALYQHICSHDEKRVKEAIEEARETGEYALEHRIETASGTLRWLYHKGQVEFQEREAVRIYGTLQDITERREGEEALKEKREEMDIFFHVVPDLLSITDAEGRILHVNKAWERTLGYTIEDLLGTSFLDLILSEDLEKTKRILEDQGSQHEILSFVLRLKDKKGVLHWFEWRSFFIHHRIYSSARDITSYIQREKELQKAREKAEEASNSKSRFLANMSHEIRTPMNSIIGFTQLAMETNPTERQRDYLEKINNSAQVLLHIINDILDLSRIEAGKVTLESVAFQLPSILKVVSDMMAFEAEKKGLSFFFYTDWDVPLELVGDPLRLQQILINLTNNAVKFTDEGEVSLRIALEEENSYGVTLSFSIRDTGIGISRDQRKRLFKAFSQADGSTTRKYGGSGLGLIISNYLVKMMGGEMRLESRPGEGSTFSFEALFRPLHESSKRPAIHPLGERVLILGTPMQEKLLQESLSPLFNEVVSIHEEEVLTHLESSLSYSLILLDSKAIENREEVLSSIKKRVKDRTPILLLLEASTSFHEKKEIEEIKELEGIHLYMKPLNNLSLYDTIHSIFTGSQKAEGEDSSWLSKKEQLEGRRILLVEDNPINLRVALEILKRFSLKVETAKNGFEAVKRLAKDRDSIHLVLMDLQMPVLDGYSATKKIRKELGIDDLPIIAMTAHALREEREKCLEVGMDDHLPKPIDQKALLDILSHYLGEKDREEEIEEEIEEDREKDKEKDREKDKEKDREEEKGLPLEKTYLGIDIEDVMQRLAGNMDLLDELLSLFLEEFKTFPETLSHLLENEEWEEAKSLVHALKGSSGNISAVSLASSARKVEELLEDGLREDLPSMVKVLEEELETLLTTASSLEEGGEEGALDPSSLATSPQEIQELSKTLYQQLRRKSLDAEKTFLSFKDSLGEEIEDEELDVIESSMKGLDFQQALEALKALSDRVGLLLEEQ